MPLTKAGQETMRNMRKQYGKGKGEDVFYAMMNKMGGKKAAKYHKKPSKKKKSK